MPTRARPFPFRPSLCFGLLLALLAVLLLAGGASREDVLGQVVVRASAWLALAMAAVFGPRPALRGLGPVLLLLSLAIALPLLQLVPLPPAIWQMLPGRQILTAAASGSDQPWRPMTMTPGATLNAAWSLVVPLTVLMLLAGLRPDEQAKLPAVLLVLAGSAMIVGLLQFSGVHIANPFVNGTPGQVSGTLANRNHFALLLAIGCLVAPAWAFGNDRRGSWRALLALASLILFVLTILASGSRAGMVTGLIAVVAGLVLIRREARRQLARGPRWIFPALVAGVVLVVGVLVTVSVFADRAESINRAMSTGVEGDMRRRGLPTVLEMIHSYFPVGSGLGGFDPMFRIHEPFSLLKPTYFNHAHNDFAEIVLDAGLAGLMVMAIALGWWAWATWCVWRRGSGHAGALARLGSVIILLLMVASTVDYPARTPLMMAILVISGAWLSRGNDARGSALPTADQRL